MKNFKGIFIFILAVFFLEASFYGSPLLSMGPTTASYASEYGLYIVKFETPYGEIYINLPDDIAKGDVISGKLTAEPSGKKEKDRAKNMELLKDYVVEIANQKTQVAEEWGKWTIPQAEELSIVLSDSQGNVAAKTQVPVLEEAPSIQTNDFKCPDYAQAGRPIKIWGKFNGDFSDTTVRMNTKELEKFAESPRHIVAVSPMDQIGSAIVDLKEGDYNAACECRNILLEPRVGKSDLKKGESTELIVTVRGLEGLEDEIPLHIENLTTNLVALEDSGLIPIQTEDVQEGGIYIFKTHITGISPGRFHIRASIVLPSIESITDF